MSAGFRSQLRTNIPGDSRISGRFNVNGATLTVLEGKRYTVSKFGTGLYEIKFGPTSTELTPFLGLIACFATAVVATPGAANSRWLSVNTINVNASGCVTGVTLVAVDQSGAAMDLAANDDICFECIVRDTEVRL